MRLKNASENVPWYRLKLCKDDFYVIYVIFQLLKSKGHFKGTFGVSAIVSISSGYHHL